MARPHAMYDVLVGGSLVGKVCSRYTCTMNTCTLGPARYFDTATDFTWVLLA